MTLCCWGGRAVAGVLWRCRGVVVKVALVGLLSAERWALAAHGKGGGHGCVGLLCALAAQGEGGGGGC